MTLTCELKPPTPKAFHPGGHRFEDVPLEVFLGYDKHENGTNGQMDRQPEKERVACSRGCSRRGAIKMTADKKKYGGEKIAEVEQKKKCRNKLT